jgi:hypothetical protein
VVAGARVPAGRHRTLFLEPESPDWERELAGFRHADVEVPATLTVDGVTCRDVGAGFRGNNSFHMAPDGLKRSFSLSLDAWKMQQALLCHTLLSLLNSDQDPTFQRSVLHVDIARR